MGLPMYRDPEEVLAENAAAKLDRVAAQRRSTIRRESSVRPGRDQSASTGLNNIIRGRHQSMLRARLRLQQETHEADSQIAQLEAELERLRRTRLRNRARLLQEADTSRMQRDENTPQDPPQPSNLDSDSVETDPTMTVAPTDTQLALPRPSRESNLRFETNATSSPRPESSWRSSVNILSPPISASGERPDRSVPDGPLEPWTTSPPLSSDFAPARAARAVVDRGVEPFIVSHLLHQVHEAERRGLETPPPETWENSYPPLRRVRHMSPRPLPRSTIDGLGDRRRSPSPRSESHEDDWTNLLTTMEHGSSSTATSFASIGDLSSSRNPSHRSSSTLNTSTSFGEIGTSAEDTCDLPPGITEEDARRIRERHRPTRQFSESRARTLERMRLFDPPPYDDDTDDMGLDFDNQFGRMVQEASDPEARIRIGPDGQVRRVSRIDLPSVHVILERLQRREPIPDEMWSMVGLPSDFGRLNNLDS